MEWLYMAIVFLLGGIVGANLIIWLNGRLLNSIADLVDTQNDMITLMWEEIFKDQRP